jgi:competence protein ComEC
VDLYVATHHGMDLSGSPAIVDALRARVTVMDNGARKGGSTAAWQTIHSAPGLEDIWQLHYSIEGGKQSNAPDTFVANTDEQGDKGFPLLVTAHADGSFTVYNSRNKYKKDYPAR